nr:hypothetical protein [Tanacetum cinerariifolium]
MLLYIKGKENRNLLVDFVLNGPFKYGTVTESGTVTTPATVRCRRCDELTNAEKIREAYDIKAINIVLQGLPQDIYNLEKESKLYDEFDMFTPMPEETIHSFYLRMTMRPIQVNKKFINHLYPEWSKFVTNVKLAKDLNNSNFDQLYAYLRQHEAHADEVRLRLFAATTIKRKATWPDSVPNLKGLGIQHDNRDIVSTRQQSQKIPTPSVFLTDNLNAFDFDCDEAPSASAVLKAKLSSYDYEILSVVPIHDHYLDNHVSDQNVQQMKYHEQLVFNNDTYIDITSDSNMISYEQYLQETKNTVVQDASYFAQKESMIMYVIEEMNNQVAKCNAIDKGNKIINDSFTAELERYKEQIKLFEERQQFDLNDSQLRKVTGQNEGSWGFEHIQKAFDKDIKPFVKTLKEYFYMFDQAKIIDYQSMEKSFLDEYSECVELKAELSKKNEMVKKAVYDELSKRCARLENKCILLGIMDFYNLVLLIHLNDAFED